MDEDGGGCIDKFEFLSYMLVHTGKASKHEIESIGSLFELLDRDGSGTLDTSDIRASMAPPGACEVVPYESQEVQTASFPRYVAAAWRLCGQWVAETKLMFQFPGVTYAKLLDASIAAVFMAVSVMVLYGLEVSGWIPFDLFAPPMLASSIIFFGGTHPPPPAAFMVGTTGAFVFGTLVNQLGASGSVVVQCVAAGLLLLFFKMSGSFFVPTVGLAAFIAQSDYEGDSILQPFAYLVAPWGTGHFLLYCSAWLLSILRRSVRVHVTKQEWKQKLASEAVGPEREAKLRKIFDRYDTSGDGALDSSELKLALRCITGEDLDADDCERIIRGIDTDGNGSIDFHEFMLAVDERA
eukprot:gnl/TRDRNA2_/TRDRNA2_161734_c0_seq2.p1 gnl/TRDRNA2_/TRDRNA2_161734_c0~~gnl/TRDRNA2_/TRDRNA2_161734_c0_seq2.p1  ORF type:complete len:380 (+),score=57.14 gnl/TRDRNA2_/TRDRNA2_161734_c0_seq2:85-1140(+)